MLDYHVQRYVTVRMSKLYQRGQYLKRLEIKDIDRQISNNNSKAWKIRNYDYVRERDTLHTRRNTRVKAIPLLEKKIEKYLKEIKEIDKKLNEISRYRTPTQKRRRRKNGERRN